MWYIPTQFLRLSIWVTCKAIRPLAYCSTDRYRTGEKGSTEFVTNLVTYRILLQHRLKLLDEQDIELRKIAGSSISLTRWLKKTSDIMDECKRITNGQRD